MMTQKEIRRRIEAVRNTQKITRAMKLVAAAKLRGAQQRAIKKREYTSALFDITVRVSRRLGRDAPALWRRPEGIDCVDVIVITSDRGLCGGFNENLLREVDEGILQHLMHNIAVKIFVLGKQGIKWLTARGYDVVAIPTEAGLEAAVKDIVAMVTERCASGESSGCNIAFNRFVSAARQKPAFWNLLPLSYRGFEPNRNVEYLYEPIRKDSLDALADQIINGALRQALFESEASEHAARMTAMDAATRNAEDMIEHLTSVYNKVRQESITSDLMDIVNGAEALRSA